ncbi:MAG: flagellar biosynthetic protein FliO [Spirochaetaceae bacterium]|jgi:flagellar protein FliO/FliZ|nr:flagellar biosynthetic protein FliO [Spirochaetaceae bacterium]
MVFGRGNLKRIILFFAALILAGGFQNQIFSQTIDETDDSGALDAGTIAAADNPREAERAYLLGEEPSEPQRQSGDISVWTVFRGVVVLALAAAAVYGIVYLLKRKKTDNIQDNAYLKVLARTSINMKTAAAVIAVGNKAWLVGLSDTNVSAIAEINDQETVDAMLLAYSEHAAKEASPLNFTKILRHLSGMSDTGGAISGKAPETQANLQRNRERLKNL